MKRKNFLSKHLSKAAGRLLGERTAERGMGRLSRRSEI